MSKELKEGQPSLENFGPSSNKSLTYKDIQNNSALPEVRLGFLFRPFHFFFELLNDLSTKFVPASFNPIAQAGAIANTSFLIAAITGVILLIWYVPSVYQAYGSLENMKSNFLTAQLMRSLHRYSSDACIFFATLHGFSLFFSKRFTGPRWLAWVTGLFSIGLLWFIGWIGYWLVWDVRAKEVALSTAKLLDILPIFADPLSRSFLTDSDINTLLFFVIFFFHMLLPLAMAFALWLHITRLNRSKFFTNRNASIWLVSSMVLLSLWKPALNEVPAKMNLITTSFTMDYWYLAPLYISERFSGGVIWGFLFFGGIILFTIPWWLSKGKVIPSEVAIERCNACKSCYNDCPYGAITMVPRTDGKSFESQAHVNPDLCVGCGICNASCSTNGVGIPWFTVKNGKDILDNWSEEILKTVNSKELIAFVCSESYNIKLGDKENGISSDLEGYRVMQVPCAGWVHTNLIERLLSRNIPGVLIAGCADGNCTYREGTIWTEKRLFDGRKPYLKEEIRDLNRVLFLRKSIFGFSDLKNKAKDFRKTLVAQNAQKSYGVIQIGLFSLIASVILGGLIWFLSDLLYNPIKHTDSELVVSFKHPGVASLNCKTLTPEELAKLPMHMRKPTSCERKRADVRMKILVDGNEILNKSYIPQGIWKDGNSIALEHISQKDGLHTVQIMIGDKSDENWDYVDTKQIEFKARFRKVVIFNKLNGFTWH